jgi:hypothetical protein
LNELVVVMSMDLRTITLNNSFTPSETEVPGELPEFFQVTDDRATSLATQLQWVQMTCKDKPMITTTYQCGLGMNVVDPVRQRIIQVSCLTLCFLAGSYLSHSSFLFNLIFLSPQFGGIDTPRSYPSGFCITFDLISESWQVQSSCTYVDTYGPFFTYDAAYVIIPERRKVYFFGGSQTIPNHSFLTSFAGVNDHWVFDLDTLEWEHLIGMTGFWGLPLLTGACQGVHCCRSL